MTTQKIGHRQGLSTDAAARQSFYATCQFVGAPVRKLTATTKQRVLRNSENPRAGNQGTTYPSECECECECEGASERERASERSESASASASESESDESESERRRFQSTSPVLTAAAAKQSILVASELVSATVLHCESTGEESHPPTGVRSGGVLSSKG